MNAPQAGHDAFAMLIAQLVFGDDGNESEANEQGDDHRPHEAVTVMSTGNGRVDQIAGT